MDSEREVILSIFAHPDDELSAIGTLANHVKRGDKVVMIWTTYGELTSAFPNLTPDEVKQIRYKHALEIQKIVGAHEIRVLDMGDLNVRVTPENTLALAKLYCEFKPTGIITWDLYNRHPDHRNTARLVIDAITYARIPKVMNDMEPHRARFPVFQYFTQESTLPSIEVDVTESMDVIREAVNFYAQIYDWKHMDEWITAHRIRLGFAKDPWYAEKFNAYNWHVKPATTLPTRIR